MEKNSGLLPLAAAPRTYEVATSPSSRYGIFDQNFVGQAQVFVSLLSHAREGKATVTSADTGVAQAQAYRYDRPTLYLFGE